MTHSEAAHTRSCEGSSLGMTQVLPLLKSSGWNLLGTLVRVLFGTILSVAIARGLGPVEMGRYGYFLWLVGIVTSFVSLGFPATIRRYVAEFLGSRDYDNARALTRAMFQLGGGAFSVASVALICGALFFADHGEWVLYGLAAILVVLSGMLTIAEAVLVGVQDFRAVALVSALICPLNFVLVVVAITLGLGLDGVFSMSGLTTCLALWLFARAARRCLGSGPQVPIARSLWNRIIRYSFSLSLILLFDAIVWKSSEIFFLKRFSTPEQIAFYTIAFSLAQAIPLLSSFFSSTILPMVSHLVGAGNKDDVAVMFPKVIRYLGLIASPICLGGSAIVGPFIVAAYGAPYQPAGLLGTLLFVSGLSQILAGGASAYICGMERPQFNVWLSGAMALLDLILAWNLVPRYGAIGATLASVISQTGASVGIIAYTIWRFEFHFPLRALGRIILAGLLCGGSAAALCWMLPGVGGVVGAMLVGAVIYLLSLWTLRAVEPSDWEFLSSVGQVLPSRLQLGYMRMLSHLSRS